MPQVTPEKDEKVSLHAMFWECRECGVGGTAREHLGQSAGRMLESHLTLKHGRLLANTRLQEAVENFGKGERPTKRMIPLQTITILAGLMGAFHPIGPEPAAPKGKVRG